MHGPRAIHSINVKANAPPTVVVAWKNNSASGRPVEVFASAVQSCTENMRVIRYVMPVTNAIERVIPGEKISLETIVLTLRVVEHTDSKRRVSGRVRHLFSDMRYTIEAAKTVKRVDQSSDKADDIVFPASLINPCPENKLGGSMARSLCCYNNHDNKPSNLKIEH